MSQVTRVLGCNPLTASYVYSNISFSPNSVFEQSLRWKRKPIWLPTAKSKIFRVPERPVIPPEEVQEIKRLYNQYRTIVNSLRKHMIKMVEESKIELDPLLVEKAKEDDFKASSAINDVWNKNILIEREERLTKQRKNRKEQILMTVEKREQLREKQKKKATEEIRKAKELVSICINSSNIDQAIQEALKNVVDHSFAIDVDGNKYTGIDLEMGQKQYTKKDQVSQ